MPDGAPPVDGETLERLYGKLWLTRRFEEVVAEIYPTDKIKSPVHLSIGQEAVAVGVCDALRPDDVVSRHLPRPCHLPGEGRRRQSHDGGAVRQG